MPSYVEPPGGVGGAIRPRRIFPKLGEPSINNPPYAPPTAPPPQPATQPSNPVIPTVDSPEFRALLGSITGQGGVPDWRKYLEQLSDVQREYMDANPETAFTAYNMITGNNRGTAYSRWANNNYNDYIGQWKAANVLDPTLKWIDFLGKMNPAADYKITASPEDRGDKYGYSMAPTMRMGW